MLRIILLVVCLAAGATAFAQTRGADHYPNRAVRIVVPFPPGGPTDIYARLLAHKLQAALGQPFIVENRPGATGSIGTSFVANAPADGYTLLFAANSSQVVSSLLQPKRPPGALTDFTPLSMLLRYSLCLLLNNDVPARSVAELAALAKAHPGQLNMGSVGTGSAGHVVIQMFTNAAGISAVHVPYKGAAAAQLALMAGEIHFLFNGFAGSQALVEAKQVRAIAVTGRERLPALPEVPTLKESGYDGFEDLVIWLGMLAPAGTPEPVAKRLEAELMRIAHLPDIRRHVEESSSVLVGGTAEEFADAIARETRAWGAIIRANNITPDN
jgi:tripartite-type tricarboxylate transporter receptor subunit TctC